MSHTQIPPGTQLQFRDSALVSLSIFSLKLLVGLYRVFWARSQEI